ncbi:alpha-amylase family glycosyl hydrolase [Sediminitomix flava]|uniref:1,4-alpha-glucan branching enzyme n=1 Tax=Sediminitomix flava TaxID=379075 RepID=A0A315Z924_SEDFL|nr:alpha-amylase family glycosyl hydrolase [Sediminitomix flava]PWJ42001.1 1,4-alpha-glucan branching enzyme [Sediminitomix flava]
MKTNTKNSDLRLLKDDPWLEPHAEEIENRFQRFQARKEEIENSYGSLKEFASAHKFYGFNYDEKLKGWYYREWAPNAHALYLIGDFNNWDRTSHPLKSIGDGNWEIFLSDAGYQERLTHESKLKVHVVSDMGGMDRIPSYIRRVVQEQDSPNFTGQFWNPEKEFDWSDDKFSLPTDQQPLIYEAHVGMAQETESVGTYSEFVENVLPRIKKLGYNTIQLMAVQEHPYYGSFGYHVSNFFAPTSRFGTPEELKELIKSAHKEGIAVIMDIVHSHAVKNLNEGLNFFDGTEYQYFHSGGKGEHPDWDSKLFDYAKPEVSRFLLSNVRYWLEEFHFDGFRFDGVTSMLYHHHGHAGFNSYDDYFGMGTDVDAITYIQLANELTHEVSPTALTIAEDVSGMPGLCRPVDEGGVGFDFRLGMGIPDFWIKILEEQRDEDWNMWDFWNVMINRRWNEKSVAYAESHDQALVGDKTLAFWLMDKEMYWSMNDESESPIIDRGIALHKMIRMLTASAGGDAYLTFMGNEFGHPEWVDFPREGNGWSYKHARRQWSLADKGFLRYKDLNNFDQGMIELLKEYNVLSDSSIELLNVDNDNKTLIFKRGELVFVFNFHYQNSIPDYKFHVNSEAKFKIVFTSDEKAFGGFDRLDRDAEFFSDKDQKLSIYNINRAVVVYKEV